MHASFIATPRVFRYSGIFLGIFLQATPATSRAQRPSVLSTRDIAARATPATATIVALSQTGDTLAQGSGFFVRSSGILVTNWHVMQGAFRAVVIRPNGERFDRVTFLDGDSAIDIAVLRVPGYGLPVLSARGDAPEVGEKIVAIGSPLGLARTVTEGIISAIRLVDGRQLIQISAPISHGSSGGAVLDATGRVFAISTAQLSEGQQLNFAVPVRYALGMLTGTSREQSLGAVFGAARGEGGAQSSPSPRSIGTQMSSSPPMHAALIRPTMDGAWIGDERAADSTGAYATAEILLIANGEGFMIHAAMLANDTIADEQHVAYISDARAASDGRVAFTLGTVAYDGYETDDGFYMGTLWRNLSPPQRSRANFKRADLPLTDNSGPYDITACRTWFYSSKEVRSSDPSDWSGSLVAAIKLDTVYVAMSLRNAAGGLQESAGRVGLPRTGLSVSALKRVCLREPSRTE